MTHEQDLEGTDSRQPVIWAGIDWGTHSSKWAYFRSGDPHTIPVVGRIRNSNLLKDGMDLIFSPETGYPSKVKPVHSIKKRIINDPASPFWDGVRSDTETTIGEAVAFSLTNLLVDLNLDLAKKGIHPDSNTPWEIGFSLPNWVEEEDEVQRAALAHFHQAVMVALSIFVRSDPEELPKPEQPFEIVPEFCTTSPIS